MAGLLVKLRRFIELNDEEAIFLFFQGSYRKLIYPGHKLLSEIAAELDSNVLMITLTKENTFGDLDKKFIRAEIKELAQGNAWSLKLTYSYYAMYEYDEFWVYKSQQEAERRLLLERCHGYLLIKNKAGETLNITPAE